MQDTLLDEVVELGEAVEESTKTNVSFEIDTKKLLAIVQKAVRSTAKTSTIEVLKGVYFAAYDEGLILRAQNSNNGIELLLPADENDYVLTSGTPGAFVVIDPTLVKVIQKLPSKKTIVTVMDGNAHFKAGKAFYDIPVLEADQFPAFPKKDTAVSITVKAEELKQLYKQTAFACSTSQTRPILTGLNHKLTADGTLKLVATDSHRLAQAVKQVDVTGKELNLTVPADSVKEIINLLSDGEVTINFADTQVFFEIGETTFFALTLEGNYPDTDRLVITSYTTEIAFRVSEIHAVLDRAMLTETTTGATLLAKPSLRQARVKANEAQKKSFQEDLLIGKGEGKDILMKFNGKYALDALSTLNPGAMVKLQFLGDSKPFLMRVDNADERNLHLVLPIRSSESGKEVIIDKFSADMQTRMEDVYEDAADALANELDV